MPAKPGMKESGFLTWQGLLLCLHPEGLAVGHQLDGPVLVSAEDVLLANRLPDPLHDLGRGVAVLIVLTGGYDGDLRGHGAKKLLGRRGAAAVVTDL